jgi:hypothetical protein
MKRCRAVIGREKKYFWLIPVFLILMSALSFPLTAYTADPVPHAVDKSLKQDVPDKERGAEGFPPRIISFRAQPPQIKAGDTATLEWETTDTCSVSISGVGKVRQSGSVKVRPERSTAYVLTATNAEGQEIREEVRVSVMRHLK